MAAYQSRRVFYYLFRRFCARTFIRPRWGMGAEKQAAHSFTYPHMVDRRALKCFQGRGVSHGSLREPEASPATSCRVSNERQRYGGVHQQRLYERVEKCGRLAPSVTQGKA